MAVTRDHILKEIRRTSETNGGVAIGKRKFETLTGLKESDWSGRYWVRWSDAVREAGLDSQVWGEAHSDETLIGKLAVLVRELGHFPVHAELEMKRRSDETFPSEKSFRRFGGKAALVEKVRNYCEEHSGFDDVLALCALLTENSKSATSEVPESVEFGWVYLVKSGKYFKIGHSNSAGRRHYELSIQLPERLREIHKIRTDDPEGIEAYWHKRFESKRLNGEWFDLSVPEVNAFRRRRFM